MPAKSKDELKVISRIRDELDGLDELALWRVMAYLTAWFDGPLPGAEVEFPLEGVPTRPL